MSITVRSGKEKCSLLILVCPFHNMLMFYFLFDSGSYVPLAWEKKKAVLSGSLAPLLI